MTFARWLKQECACSEAIKWVGRKEFERTIREIDHPGWLIWLIKNLAVIPLDTRFEIRAGYNKRYLARAGRCDTTRGAWLQDLSASDQRRRGKRNEIQRCNWLRAQMKPYLPKRMVSK